MAVKGHAYILKQHHVVVDRRLHGLGAHQQQQRLQAQGLQAGVAVVGARHHHNGDGSRLQRRRSEQALTQATAEHKSALVISKSDTT